MPVQLCLLKFALAELFVQVSYSGQLTLADRYGLLAAIMEDACADASSQGALTTDERASIDRMLYAVHKGRLRMVDELSAVASG